MYAYETQFCLTETFFLPTKAEIYRLKCNID